MPRFAPLLLALVALGAPGLPPAAADPAPPPRLATLPLPGPAAFADPARDIVAVAFALDPSLAANAGLFEDASAVPHLDPASRRAYAKRLARDRAALRAAGWRSWPVDVQIDTRWVYAVAQTLERQLLVEKPYTHRPAQWLEPVANSFIALLSYAPQRTDLQDALLAQIPAMLDEIHRECLRPTTRDVEVARRLVAALVSVSQSRGNGPVTQALTAYAASLDASAPTREAEVIGADNVAWRLQNTLLLPWTPAELLAAAQADLAAVDARVAALPEAAPRPGPSVSDTVLARDLRPEQLLGLYDELELRLRAATVAGGWVTVSDRLGAVRSRATPDLLVPLTGDGGSMNPAPTFFADPTSWWNVEHFNPAWTEEERAKMIAGTSSYLVTGMGTYAAHEGWPGHHLQLAVARLNPDPLRSILPDPVQNEGWGLYAEEVLWEHGGLGPSKEAERNVLNSYRHRIRRVVYDLNIETGAWTLQQAADYKYGKAGAPLDEELLRSINWPTQLLCYYTGKKQILALKEAARARPGWDERAFHDAFLAEGSIPTALVRAKLLGEPVPDLPAE